MAAAGSLFGGTQGTGWAVGSAALLPLPLLGQGLVWSLFPPAPSSSIFRCSFLPLGPVLSPLFQLVAPPSASFPSLSFSALACLAVSAWEPVRFSAILVMILLPSYSVSPPVSARLSSHLSLCLPSLSAVLPPLLSVSLLPPSCHPVSWWHCHSFLLPSASASLTAFEKKVLNCPPLPPPAPKSLVKLFQKLEASQSGGFPTLSSFSGLPSATEQRVVYRLVLCAL